MTLKSVKQLIYGLLLLLVANYALAGSNFLNKLRDTPTASPFAGAHRYAPPEEVFLFSASYDQTSNAILLHWEIKPGYYLYRDRFAFKTADDVTLGQARIPAGIVKNEKGMGRYEIFKNAVDIRLPVLNSAVDQVNLVSSYQGCAEDGYCYPPMQTTSKIDLKHSGTSSSLPLQDRLSNMLQSSTLWLTLVAFYGLGILLAFTPCVLPMLPILSSIIVGQGENITQKQAFVWSSLYVLGMAVTYTIIGVIAALAGHSIQAALQTPWVIIVFVLLFVGLALSLFNFFHIRLPHALEQKLHQVSHSQNTESYIGVTVLGALSALVVSPCITPPLIGALAYIGQTGDTILGGSALLALSLGMGTPLIAVATIGAHWLPAAGPWMDNIKATFGVMMLALAITLLERFWAGPFTLILWAMLAIIAGVYLGAFSTTQRGWPRFWQGLGLVAVIYGVIAMIGALAGHGDALRPLAGLSTNTGPNTEIAATSVAPATDSHIRVSSIAELDMQLKQAAEQKQVVFLDYSADWCATCQHMQKTTFSDPQVIAALAKVRWLLVDVTANNMETSSLQQRYHVFAPPTLVFLDANGQERPELRRVGEVNAETLMGLLGKL